MAQMHLIHPNAHHVAWQEILRRRWPWVVGGYAVAILTLVVVAPLVRPAWLGVWLYGAAVVLVLQAMISGGGLKGLVTALPPPTRG